MKEQLHGGMIEADKDQLITEDSDAVYRKCPGVNNVAYVVRDRGESGHFIQSYIFHINPLVSNCL